MRKTYGGQTKNPIHPGTVREGRRRARSSFSDLEDLLVWVSDATAEEFERAVDTQLRDGRLHRLVRLCHDRPGERRLRQERVPRSRRGRSRHPLYGTSLGPERLAVGAVLEHVPRRVRHGWRPARSHTPRRQRCLGAESRPARRSRSGSRIACARRSRVPASLEQMLAMFDAMVAEVRPSAHRSDRKWDADAPALGRRTRACTTSRKKSSTSEGRSSNDGGSLPCSGGRTNRNRRSRCCGGSNIQTPVITLYSCAIAASSS